MVKPSYLTDSLCTYQKGYQQALEHFAIGRFYSFAPHHCDWMWCYLIWLDKLSPSSPWTVADIAWENDLERVEEAA